MVVQDNTIKPAFYDLATAEPTSNRGIQFGTQWKEEIANDDALLLRARLRCDCGGLAHTQSGILSGAEPVVDAARKQDSVG